MIRLLQWSREVWRWLAEGKIPFMGLLMLIALLLLGLVTWHTEVSIRSAGFALQVLGMIFAIRGLLGIRAHFGQPLLRTLFIKWLKRFPRWKQNVVFTPSGGVVFTGSGSGTADVWIPDKPELPLEKRIEAIVKNLERIRNAQYEHRDLIHALEEGHENHKKAVAEQSKKLEESIRSDLESLHTGDLVTSLVGLVWLTIGSLLSTLAPELHAWLY